MPAEEVTNSVALEGKEDRVVLIETFDTHSAYPKAGGDERKVRHELPVSELIDLIKKYGKKLD